MIIKEICTDVYSIKPSLHDDNRGSFFELYNKFNFTNLGFDNNFLQDNVSFSKKKDTVRGFHYQKPPHEQSKFIFLISGSIIDIFIDIRKESKNFGNCYSIKLNNLGDGLFLPKGFDFIDFSLYDRDIIINILFQGFVPNIFGLYLTAFATKSIGTAKASSILAAVPISGAILGFFFLSEIPTYFSWMSLFTVSIGILIIVLRKKKHA